MRKITPTLDIQNFVSLYLQDKEPASVYKKIVEECRNGQPVYTRELAILELKMHAILEHLPFTDRLVCMTSVEDVLKKYRFHFYRKPTITISIVDTKEDLQIPLSFVAHSKTIKEQSDEEDTEPCMISLPWGFTKEDLETGVQLLSRPEAIFDLATWLRALITAERFTCDKEILHNLQASRPRPEGSLEELETALALHSLLHPNIACEIVSEYLCKYIDLSLQSIAQICVELKNSKLVQQYMETIPINLHLSHGIAQDDLQLLASTIKNVVSIDVQFRDNNVFSSLFEIFASILWQYQDTVSTVFPTLWENTLRKLTLQPGYINQIPEPLLARLEVLHLNTPLQDYAVLNDRTNLTELRLRHIHDIHSAPRGCHNLKVFYADSCRMLKDLSPLNNLLSLEICLLGDLSITAIPSDLLNLKQFAAAYCPNLSDFSPLNGRESLEICKFRKVNITSAPSGCRKLKTFEAKNCPQLTDVSELNNLPHLHSCTLEETPVDGFKPIRYSV